MKNIEAIKYPLVLIKNPAGTYSFVGNVPMPLAYTMKDGSPVTPEAEQTMRQCGPGFAKVRSCTWPDVESALYAAKVLGVTVDQVCP